MAAIASSAPNRRRCGARVAQSEWDAADGDYPASDDDGGGRWYCHNAGAAEGGRWRGAKRTACTPFRHLGFFPDMAPVWDWLPGGDSKPDPAFLNLFGYRWQPGLAARARR